MQTTNKLRPGQPFAPMIFKQLGGSDVTFGAPGGWQALFLVNPEGALHLVDIANAPFLRPDPDRLAGGLRFVIEENYPIRSTGK